MLPEARFVAREITLGHGPAEVLTSPSAARTASELLGALGVGLTAPR
ncbi:hypothetical protein [Streptomyces sp. NPDC052701]